VWRSYWLYFNGQKMTDDKKLIKEWVSITTACIAFVTFWGLQYIFSYMCERRPTKSGCQLVCGLHSVFLGERLRGRLQELLCAVTFQRWAVMLCGWEDKLWAWHRVLADTRCACVTRGLSA